MVAMPTRYPPEDGEQSARGLGHPAGVSMTRIDELMGARLEHTLTVAWSLR